ncbi:Spindle and kinetochore-associated protein 2 [Lamellibrachia satsuma]|nr:Spindle and kinetochore-associated protein 2 [Lamellibrachia satsuma]
MAGLAVDKLEAMFNKADADLDYLSRKLEFEVECKEENAGQMNTSVLLRRIAEVKHEFAAIVKEVEAIKDAEKEAMDFFRGELVNVCQLLTNLQDRSGTQIEKPEELTRMESLLGVATDQPESVTPNGASASAEGQNVAALPNGTSESNGITGPSGTSAQMSQVAASEFASDIRMSASERRQCCEDILEVEEEEFVSVSTLVRGRVKLADVNQLYRVLWRHFKEERNSEALTPSDMYKMGLRVTGQTGQAKLKVLKSLKLVDVTKKGDVILL